MTINQKPITTKPLKPPPAGNVKMKCIPIELYEKLKKNHPEYFL